MGVAQEGMEVQEEAAFIIQTPITCFQVNHTFYYN